jgi:hypothetical protein
MFRNPAPSISYAEATVILDILIQGGFPDSRVNSDARHKG